MPSSPAPGTLPRIAYDARQAKYNTSGLGRYTFAVLHALIEQPDLYRRLEVLIDEGTDDGRNPLFRRLRAAAEANPKVGFEVLRAPLYSLRHHVTVARAVRRLEADRYFYPYFDRPLGVSCPTQFVLHDMFILQMPEYLTRFPRSKRLYYRWVVGRALAHPRVECVAVSRTTAQEIHRYFGGSIRHPLRVALEAPVELSTTADTVDHALLSRLPSRFLFYVGDRRPHKNLRRMLDIFHRLKTECGYPGEFVLAGGTRNFDFDPEAYAQSIPGVRFLGTISDATRNVILGRMESLILLSRHEGFGLPIVEAGSAGARVITSSASAMAEVAPPWACLVDPEATAEAAARQIAAYFADRPLIESAAYAARFCWKRCAREIFATPPCVPGPHHFHPSTAGEPLAAAAVAR